MSVRHTCTRDSNQINEITKFILFIRILKNENLTLNKFQIV